MNADRADTFVTVSFNRQRRVVVVMNSVPFRSVREASIPGNRRETPELGGARWTESRRDDLFERYVFFFFTKRFFLAL